MNERENVIKALECCNHEIPKCEKCPYNDGGDTCPTLSALFDDAIALLKAQEPRVTCSVCKYSRCLSGEWFCFMIGTSRYGKHVTDGDWYCKDAIGR